MKRELFGVQLPDKVSAILAEVEQLFGNSVREEWLSPDHPMSGNSTVAEDGTPIIQINPGHGRTQDVILHELYHFKLRNSGYPVLLWLFPTEMNTDAHIAAFKQLSQQLYDPLLHYVFYPEVRASIGIDPGETFERRTREALFNKSFVSTIASMDRGAAALYYFKVRIEVADLKLTNEVVTLLENKGKQEGVRFGEQLVGIVQDATPTTPTGTINVLLELLNRFYQGHFRFVQRGLTSRQLGAHAQQMSQIEVVPTQGAVT